MSSGAQGRTYPRMFITARSGSWCSTCSTSWPGGASRPRSCGDGIYGDSSEFRLGLVERDIPYVLDAKAKTSALPQSAQPERAAYDGRGRPQAPRYRPPFSSLRELALAARKGAAEEMCWRQGSRGAMRSRFIALRIRPANIKLRRAAAAKNEELPACWLLAEWPKGESEPVKYWISNLPPDRSSSTFTSPSSAGASSTTTASQKTPSA
jgi:SRSO17 transposase